MGAIVAGLLLLHDDFRVEFMSIKFEIAAIAKIAVAFREERRFKKLSRFVARSVRGTLPSGDHFE
jgi:hypothetical protein